MLRQSLKSFLRSLSMSSNVRNALQKIDENEFNKRLRNELIMLPIPKAKFNDRKVPIGVNPADFEDAIIEKQSHVLKCAISRVSQNIENPSFGTKVIIFIKLVLPSAMDPQGILMLNSIRNIFDTAGISIESMKFVEEKFDNQGSVIDALYQNKCPAIVGAKFDFSSGTIESHCMVAAGIIETQTIGSSIEYFLQCKNSFRDDPNQPGKFHHVYSRRLHH